MGKRLHPEVQAPFSYKLHQNVHNQYRGDMSEKIIYTYFEHDEIPKLKSQGWDMVFIERVMIQLEVDPLYEYPKMKSLISSDRWLKEEWEKMQYSTIEFFLRHNIFPSKKVELNFHKLLAICKNKIPDGFLFKIKKIGEITLEEARKKRVSRKSEFYSYDVSDGKKLIPIIDGEIEVIEVKSNKDNLSNDAKHAQMYRRCLSEGFRLQWFNVEIISFEKNEFNVNLKIYDSNS